MISLSRLTGPFREFGLFGGTIYCLNRVFLRSRVPVRLFQYEFMAQPIVGTSHLPDRVSRFVQVRELPCGDPAYRFMPLTPEVLDLRHRQNTVCLGAFQRDALLAYMWFCFGSYEEDEVRCLFLMRPIERSVWDFDFYVFPEHRAGFAFVALWDRANAYLRDRGVETSFSRVSRFNSASRNAHSHFQWTRLGRALFLRAGRAQAMIATCAPYIHISLTGKSRPTVALSAPRSHVQPAIAASA